MEYEYSYLLFTLLYAPLWVALYLWRRDVRKEMVVMSLLFGVAGIVSEFIYIQDWWQPLTLTGTFIGLEDFVIGFFIGGVASVIYEELFKKKIKPRKVSSHTERIEIFHFFSFLLFFTFLFLGSFYFFNIHSFYASLLAFGGALSYLLYRRPDLFLDSLFSGVLMLVIGFLVYFFLDFFTPGFIRALWYLPDYWFSTLFLGVPLAEYIWYFLAGAYIGPLYEFWKESRVVSTYQKNSRRKHR